MLLKNAKRVVVFVLGMTVLLIGIVGAVLPVIPGVVLVPAGLAILATEFAWARRFLRRVKERLQGAVASQKPQNPPSTGEQVQSDRPTG